MLTSLSSLGTIRGSHMKLLGHFDGRFQSEENFLQIFVFCIDDDRFCRRILCSASKRGFDDKLGRCLFCSFTS